MSVEIIPHTLRGIKAAEIKSAKTLIIELQNALDLLGDVYYQGYDMMILHREHFSPEFFDLKSKLAGDILQKFSNYHMRLVILGDFSKESSSSLRDFMYESNQGGQVQFVSTLAAIR